MDFDDGAAWSDEDVCERLGIGCRPNSGAPSTVPTGLDAASTVAVGQYLDGIASRQSLPDKQQYIESGTDLPAGRRAFDRWFRKTIAPRLNRLTEDTMSQYSVHPADIIKLDRRAEWPPVSKVSKIIDAVADVIFGEACSVASGVHDDIHPFVSSIITSNWDRLRKTYNRAKKSMEANRAKAVTVVNGE